MQLYVCLSKINKKNLFPNLLKRKVPLIMIVLQIILAILCVKLFFWFLEVRILRALIILTHFFLLLAKGHALKPQVASIFTSFLDGLKKFYITKVTVLGFNTAWNFVCYP